MHASVVQDVERPISQRMRAIFFLKEIGGDAVVPILAKGASLLPARVRLRIRIVFDGIRCFGSR